MKSPVPCRQNIISAMCGQEVINTLLTSCKTNIWKTQKENNFYIFHMPQLNQSKFLEIKLYCTYCLLYSIDYSHVATECTYTVKTYLIGFFF